MIISVYNLTCSHINYRRYLKIGDLTRKVKLRSYAKALNDHTSLNIDIR